MLYREQTPLECHRLRGRLVRVKRDDLFGIPPAPPLGKLRGLRTILDREYQRGTRLIGCWDTRVSKLGLGVAAACRLMAGVRCVLAYPGRAGAPPPTALLAGARLGAELLPVAPNHLDICYSVARRQVVDQGGVMLPFGLDCEDSVAAVSAAAAGLPASCTAGGTVVLSCGSGVTTAGVCRGLRGRPSRIIAVSSGRSIGRIARCIRRYLGEVATAISIVPAAMPYAAVPVGECPFPTHPNYDLKAWIFLEQHLPELAEPILFWNIGA